MLHLRQNIIDNPLLAIHLKGMQFCGFAIFDGQRFQLLHKIKGFVVIFIWTEFIITQFIDLYQSFGDIGKMAKNAPSTLLFSIVLAQCYSFLYYKSDLMTLLITEIDTSMNKIRDCADLSEKHRRNISSILAQNVRYSNKLTIVFWSSTFVTTTTMCLLGFLNYFYVTGLNAAERVNFNPLMLSSWYPVDIYEYFIPIYIHQVVNCYLGMIIIPLMFTCIIAFKIYVSAMLQILKYRCETITDDLNGTRLIGDRDLVLKQKICDIVATQLEIGRFVQNLNDLISSSMFCIFVIFSVLLCGLLFQLSMMKYGADVLLSIACISETGVILLLFYWHANEITYHSDGLSNSIYFCNWYTCSKSFKKLMLIFMIGSQRPLTVSALYFTMTLAAYIQILKASYSYFTLLSQISDRG